MMKKLMKVFFVLFIGLSMVIVNPEFIKAEEEVSPTSETSTISTLKIHYQYYDGKNAAPDYNESYNNGDSYNVASPTLKGFIADKANVTGTINGDLEITVTYSPDTVNYYVEHYFQNADGSYNSTPDQKDTLTGKVGSYTVATPHTKVGYKLDGVVEQQLIKDYPTLVGGEPQTIKIKYERVDLAVYFNVNGGEYMNPITGKYGQSIDISNSIPTRAGYVFDGWYSDSALTNKVTSSTVTLGTSSAATPVNLYAKWKVGDPVNYTVVFWEENANDDGYSYFKTENFTKPAETPVAGLVGTEAITYFTYDHYTSSDTEVAGDGSTIINVYYKRNVYECTFNINQADVTLTINGKTYSDATTKYSFKAKYQQDITNLWPLADTLSEPANQNKFYGWYATNLDQTNYVSKRLTLTPQMCNTTTGTAIFDGRWSATVNGYKLHYMTESLDGNGETRLDSTGTPDLTDLHKYNDNPLYSQVAYTTGANWSAKDLIGFTENGVKYQETTDIDGNGFIDVYFYYTRDKANFTLYNYDNTLVTKQFFYDSSISDDYGTFETSYKEPARPASLSTAYKFDGWYENEDCNDTDTSNDVKFNPTTNTDKMSATGKILYARWVAQTHKVTFNYDNGTPTTNVDVVDKQSVVEPTEPTRDGYVFTGWYKDDGTKYDFSTKVTEDTNLTAKWVKVVYTNYNVYYKKAADNTDLSAPTTESAIVSTTVVKEAQEIAGYVPDMRFKQINDIKANNTESITFKYSPLTTDIYYRVKYVNAVTKAELAPSEVHHGLISKASANAKTISGYTVDASSKEIILGKEESEAAINQNEIIFEYTPIEYTLTIKYEFKYEDEADPTLKPNDYVGQYETNELFEITSPTIEGYTCDQDIVRGFMAAGNKTITVYYTKIDSGHEPDPTPTPKPGPEEVPPTTNGGSPISQGASNYVKTGDDSQIMTYGIFMLVSLIAAVVASIKRKTTK